jgi:hypothetical protein
VSDRRWRKLIFLSILVGLVLRLMWTSDMEYKEDEEYHFVQSQTVGKTQPWPWVGIPSGVFLVNPGASVWVYVALARITGASDPVALQKALSVFAVLGMSLVFFFAYRFVRDPVEREPWLWAGCLAMVNPFLVVYQRKLWPEGFLPFFAVILLMGFWKRTRLPGAIVWGLFGAFLGQIHMSGFFLAFALFVWSLAFDRARGQTSWKGWFVGSCLGAWPLIPWMHHMLTVPAAGSSGWRWDEVVQLKYWQFWVSDPLGFHIGNPIGLLRGPSHWSQLSDFARYPLLGAGVPTWIIGFAHLGVLILAALILTLGIRHLVRNRSRLGQVLLGRESTTAMTLSSVALGCGAFMTATGVMIRRYYLCVTYPFEGVWLARLALLHRRGRVLLVALWALHLVISAGFVWYVHVNEGSPQGDYGDAYWKVLQKREALSVRDKT